MEPHKILTVGLVIESWRYHRNMTAGELAYMAGVARQTIVRIETEVSQPRRETLQKVAWVLRLDFDDMEAYQDRHKSKKVRGRGGNQSQRDREFPELQNREFRKWWHRVGKAQHGRIDIESRQAAREIYEEWKSQGSPHVKLLTKHDLLKLFGRGGGRARDA